MPVEDKRVIRELAEMGEGGVHLFRSTFKESTATRKEECISVLQVSPDVKKAIWRSGPGENPSLVSFLVFDVEAD